MFTAALFTIVEIWKQTKCPLIGEQIKKNAYTYMYTYMEVYIQWKMIYPLKEKETVSSITIWMNLEDTMLHEITQEHKYCMIPLVCMYMYSVERVEWRLPGLGLGNGRQWEENGKMLVKDHKVSVRK